MSDAQNRYSRGSGVTAQKRYARTNGDSGDACQFARFECRACGPLQGVDEQERFVDEHCRGMRFLRALEDRALVPMRQPLPSARSCAAPYSPR